MKPRFAWKASAASLTAWLAVCVAGSVSVSVSANAADNANKADQTNSQRLPAKVDLLQSPAPVSSHGQRRLLVDVANTGTRLVAVGESGLVIHSEDGGRTWAQSPTPTSVMLTAVSFPSPQAGWAVGHDGVILATRDGGLSWTRQFDGRQGDQQILEAARSQLARLPASRAGTAEAPSDQRMMLEDAVAGAQAAVDAGPSRPLLSVRFANDRTGFASGSFGQLFATEDGGKHWAYIGDRLDNAEGLHLNALTVSGDGHIYIAAESGTVFISSDMGRSWARSNLGYKGHLYGVLAMPGDVLVAYGFNGRLFRSVDGGQSWRGLISPTSRSIIGAMPINGSAMLLDEDGQVLRTTDQGETWVALGQRLPVRRVGAMALVLSTFSPQDQGLPYDLLTVGLGGASKHTLRWPNPPDNRATP